MGLQREEQKLITDIKKAAKQNNTQAARVLAKSLVRLRGQMNQLRASEAQLRGVKTSITVRIFQIWQLGQKSIVSSGCPADHPKRKGLSGGLC